VIAIKSLISLSTDSQIELSTLYKFNEKHEKLRRPIIFVSMTPIELIIGN